MSTPKDGGADRFDRMAERMPWRDPDFRLANAYAYYLWLKKEAAKRLSQREKCECGAMTKEECGQLPSFRHCGKF